MVDSRANSNLLYLPLDKLMQQAGAQVETAAPVPPPEAANPPTSSGDARSRENQRSRGREGR